MSTDTKQTVVFAGTLVVSAVTGFGIGVAGRCLFGPVGLVASIPVSFAVGCGIGWVGNKVAELV